MYYLVSSWKCFIIFFILHTFTLYLKWKYYILNKTRLNDTDKKIYVKYIKFKKEDMDSMLTFGLKNAEGGRIYIFVYIFK